MGEIMGERDEKGEKGEIVEGDYFEITGKKIIQTLDCQEIVFGEYGGSISVQSVSSTTCLISVQTGNPEDQICDQNSGIRHYEVAKQILNSIKNPRTYHLSQTSLLGARIMRAVRKIIKK